MTACRTSRFAATILLLILAVVSSRAEGGTESGLSKAFSFTDSSGPTVPKIISWRNPAIYEDGSEIDAASKAVIETRLYFSLDRVRWTRFATVPGGAESWTGSLPVGVGVTAYFAATSTIPDDGTTDSLDLFTAVIGNYGDTYIVSDTGSGTNHSLDPMIRIALGTDRKVLSRGLLKWDLSSLPDDAMVTGASLHLYYADEEDQGGVGVLPVRVAKIAGKRPDIGKASWISPDSVSGWTGGSDGGAKDIGSSESAASVGKNHGWVVWNVTNMVQQWVDEPEKNSGLVLDPDIQGEADSNRFFASREHPDPLMRPELVITYRRIPRSATGKDPGAPISFTDVRYDASEDTFTVEIGRSEDTYVNHGVYSGINYFSEPLLRTYTWPENNPANRGFIRWDLSGLPSDITVTSATLLLYYVDEDKSGGDDEYTVTVSNVAGVNPDLRLATWNSYDGVSPWPGGQNGGAGVLGPIQSSSTIGKAHRWISWDITDMVREWASDPRKNSGMTIGSDPSAGISSNRYFASREYPDPRLRPRLVITYTKNR